MSLHHPGQKWDAQSEPLDRCPCEDCGRRRGVVDREAVLRYLAASGGEAAPKPATNPPWRRPL